MFAGLKKVIAAAAVASLALGAGVPTQAAETGLQPDGTMIVGPAAAKWPEGVEMKLSSRL